MNLHPDLERYKILLAKSSSYNFPLEPGEREELETLELSINKTLQGRT